MDVLSFKNVMKKATEVLEQGTNLSDIEIKHQIYNVLKYHIGSINLLFVGTSELFNKRFFYIDDKKNKQLLIYSKILNKIINVVKIFKNNLDFVVFNCQNKIINRLLDTQDITLFNHLIKKCNIQNKIQSLHLFDSDNILIRETIQEILLYNCSQAIIQ